MSAHLQQAIAVLEQRNAVGQQRCNIAKPAVIDHNRRERPSQGQPAKPDEKKTGFTTKSASETSCQLVPSHYAGRHQCTINTPTFPEEAKLDEHTSLCTFFESTDTGIELPTPPNQGQGCVHECARLCVWGASMWALSWVCVVSVIPRTSPAGQCASSFVKYFPGLQAQLENPSMVKTVKDFEGNRLKDKTCWLCLAFLSAGYETWVFLLGYIGNSNSDCNIIRTRNRQQELTKLG